MDLDKLMKQIANQDYPIEFAGHWVHGEWVNDSRSIKIGGSYNPNRDTLLTEVSISKAIIDQAAAAAADAAPQLLRLDLDSKIKIISQFRQLIADYELPITTVLCVEAGKPRWEAKNDFDNAIQVLDQITSSGPEIVEQVCEPYRISGQGSSLTLMPVGTTAIFQNFSTPLNTVVQSFAAAILAGCPQIIMTSGHTAMMGHLLGQIIAKVDGPIGAANVLFGDFKSFTKLLQDRSIKAVIYSGSREHVDTIRQDSAPMLDRQLMLQSGGKNSLIIDESANAEQALKAIVFGMIKSAGQLNTSTSRVFIPRAQLAGYQESLTPVIRSLNIGPTDMPDADPTMGPLYARKAVEKFLRFQTMAKREAKATISWGKALDAGDQGYFVTPGVHIFDEFDPASSFQSNVFMCPDVAIYPYDQIEDAIRAANTTHASLVCSLYGEESILQNLTHLVKAPNIMLNEPTVGIKVQPSLTGKELCGGYRMSGIGILALLTYPQACHSSEHAKSVINSWPWGA